MTLVAERPHNKHGSSVFVRDGLKVNSMSVCKEENVEFITVELPVVVVHSLYKSPPEPFLLPPLGQRIKPHIVIGDFNSHSSGDTLQRIATEKRSNNGQIQTDYHSSTTRNCRNHSTVQYGRRNTTLTSSVYLQRFRICVRSLFWIQSPTHSTALSV